MQHRDRGSALKMRNEKRATTPEVTPCGNRVRSRIPMPPENDVEHGNLTTATDAAAATAEPVAAAAAVISTGLSLYELQRRVTMQENAAKLVSLGLQTTLPTVRPLPKFKAASQRRLFQPRAIEPASRASPRLVSKPLISYAEDDVMSSTAKTGGKKRVLELPQLEPGAQLELPQPKRIQKSKPAEAIDAPLVALSETERVELVVDARARYKELYIHYKVVTNGGRADLKTLKQAAFHDSCCPFIAPSHHKRSLYTCWYSRIAP